MFFNHSIELSKTRESEKRRSLEANRIASSQRLSESANDFIKEQQDSMVNRKNSIDLGFKKSNSRLLFEARISKAHNFEIGLKENLASAISGIVLESLWIDSDKKESYSKSILETSKALVLDMFKDGRLTIKAFSENKAIAVREIFEDAKERAIDAEESEELTEANAVGGNKYKDPNTETGPDDSGDSSDEEVTKKRLTQRKVEKTSAAIKAIVNKTKELVMDTIAAEKEIAEKNSERNAELKEGTRLVRPRRESPSLWRAININISSVMNEASPEEVIAESLTIYTFLETLNVMNLITISPDKVSLICKTLTEMSPSAGTQCVSRSLNAEPTKSDAGKSEDKDDVKKKFMKKDGMDADSIFYKIK
jgi:hypothetical protein